MIEISFSLLSFVKCSNVSGLLQKVLIDSNLSKLGEERKAMIPITAKPD